MADLAVWQRTIVDEEGNVIPGAEVEVRREEDDSLAMLYADRAGETPLANPLAADMSGFVRFFAQGDAYTITAVGAGSTRTWRFDPIGRLKEFDKVVAEVITDDASEQADIRDKIGAVARDANLSDLTDLKDARSNLGTFSTVAEVQSRHIPAVLESIRTNGYYTPGDGGGALYVEGDEGPGAIQSGDGRWWKPCLLAGSNGILNESDLAGVTVSDALNRTPGRTLLGQIILDEPYQGIVHFSDIPPDFTHLVLDFSARLDDPSPAANVLRLRTNSTDTATNSFGGNVFLSASSDGVDGGIGAGVSNLHICDLPDGAAAAGVYGSGSVTFYNYATLMHGPYFSRAGTHNKHMLIRMGVNTAADEIIHSLLVWAGNNSIVTGREWLAAGSRFQLWGVRGNPPVAALWGGL